ncbi:protein FAM83F isoform X1 [Labrus mixtus]|uniref:protein FAM83F isoform X1 n=1 Tax=Labrus mixtus TaxID=508554 RepID=UPI0029C0C228|nr:protein FAM83F isoform X1 [Labrus mixtus]
MSNSQEQSLDEDVVFLPVNESSPEFLHCEKERQAVERLISAGPEAFYSAIGTERSGCFLSSEEVSQITTWAQDYRFNPPQVQRLENGEEGGSDMKDFCSTYFPSHSDVPLPDLELGWPEKSPWVPKGSITVHTNPPAEGEPPVREVIRRHLQKASQVIAIVTDRLTDGAIIGDLHNAASRGVPVYIILNQRSIQENFTLNRLRHPNMQVRVLGGKTFCSRAGRMVVGEMKDKFLLVDLETVIHGSCSLTWTDAHLHRQLITVLQGPVTDSFDREFRILFAASLPVSDTWRVAETHVDVAHQLKDFSHHRFQKQLSWEREITSPPSPPADSLLDWEAMGVIQRNSFYPDSPFDQHEDILVKEISMQNNMLFANTPIVDNFTNNGDQSMDKKRVSKITSPVTNNMPEMSLSFRDPDYFHSNTQLSKTDLRSPERMKSRVEREIEKGLSRQFSAEKNSDPYDKTRLDDKAKEPAHIMVTPSPSQRRECLRRESFLEEERRENEKSSKVENTTSSRKPLILRVPQSESFSSLSDIMKRIQLQESSSGRLSRGSKAAVSEMSRSMMDLSVHNADTNHDERGVPVPRFKASCFDPGRTTPASSLMKNRSDDLKPLLYRTPTDFPPRHRPRSSSYALNMDWRRSLAEMKSEQE